MILKVCGLKNVSEINRIDSSCRPNLVGLIFHKSSPRNFESSDVTLDCNADLVGVFVNQSEDFILKKIKKHRLQYVQLHGEETPELCYRLAAHVSVIKAFGIDDQFNFDLTLPYRKACSYFLFDTSTPKYGGSGKKYDWKKLEEYSGDTPFFLSGGIGPSDAEKILSLKHPSFEGIDLNSQFEDFPGLKNIHKLNYFIENVRKNKIIHTA